MPHRITPAQQSGWRDEYWFVTTTGMTANILGRFVACRYCIKWEEPKGDSRTRGRCKMTTRKVGRSGRCLYFDPGAATLHELVRATAEADAVEVGTMD